MSSRSPRLSCLSPCGTCCQSRQLLRAERQLRFLRYDCGDVFAAHRDGPSHWATGSRPHYCSYSTSTAGDYEGGHTFHLTVAVVMILSSSSSSSGSSLSINWRATSWYSRATTQSTPVLRGRKYVLRTDVMYPSTHCIQQSLLTRRKRRSSCRCPRGRDRAAAAALVHLRASCPISFLATTEHRSGMPSCTAGDHTCSTSRAAIAPPPPYREQLAITSVPLSDFGDDDLKSRLPECFAVLEACRAAGGRCLVPARKASTARRRWYWHGW